MSGAVILDTETTDPNEPEIIEAAWLKLNPCLAEVRAGTVGMVIEQFEQRYRPSKAISFSAMAVHHILPDELEDCPPPSEFRLPADAEYLIGHNVDFDWQAIGAPDVKRICTLAMARHVWPDADAYSQSALLYMLLGATPETREKLKGAHGAMVDCANNLRLLVHILAERPDMKTWAALHACSEECRIPRVMPIGEKQGVKGLMLDEAVDADRRFCDWCLRQDWLDPYLRTGLERAMARR